MFSPLDHRLTTIGWRLSCHARERMHSRGVSVEQVVAVLTDPDLTYPSAGEVVHTRGRLAVVTNPTTHTVVTFLLTGAEPWSEDEARVLLTRR
jgi:hypothetical protein